MHAERTQQSLEAVLNQELECTESLLASLETERAALAGRDANALARSTEAKLAQIQRLESLEGQREHLLAALGFAGEPADLGSWLGNLPGTQRRLHGLWQRILANTEACRTANLTNGGILEANRQHVEQALSILRGQVGSTSVYASNGETASSLGQRDLGKV